MGSMFFNDDLPHHTAVLAHLSQPNHDDPYRYQHGFNNHHSSEAFAGALPRSGTDLPQQHPYGLYAEHLNGTSFISSRDSVSNVWMYRVRPSAAHRPLRPCTVDAEIESCFLPTNPNVNFTPVTHTWGPLPDPSPPSPPASPPGAPSPSPSTYTRYGDRPCSPRSFPSPTAPAHAQPPPKTFLTGLHTIAGHGDPTLKTGLAVHQYAFTADMTRQALTNHDGELLLIPHRGTLDIQTELGYLRVAPGSIAVIPAGIRFSIALASFPAPAGGACGYVLEVFGTRFRLPELGPLGGNALAHVRDFMYPVASFDLDFDRPPVPVGMHGDDPSEWEVVTKLAGRFHSYAQQHTPFDVVAWHGRYAPYKYDLGLFGHLSANTDQLDPTAYSVLTAPNPANSSTSLVDFCIFGEKWAVSRDTLRIPYHHRTMASELMGIVHGGYGGSTRRLEGGGLSFEQAYVAHGETYECWKAGGEKRLAAEVVGRGTLSFMLHVPGHVALTKFAMERHADIRLQDPDIWTTLRAPFIEKLGEARRALEKMRMADEAAIQAELTALAFEVMANKRRLSSMCVTDDEGEDFATVIAGRGAGM